MLRPPNSAISIICISSVVQGITRPLMTLSSDQWEGIFDLHTCSHRCPHPHTDSDRRTTPFMAKMAWPSGLDKVRRSAEVVLVLPSMWRSRSMLIVTVMKTYYHRHIYHDKVAWSDKVVLASRLLLLAIVVRHWFSRPKITYQGCAKVMWTGVFLSLPSAKAILSRGP